MTLIDGVSPARWHQASEIAADCLEIADAAARDAHLDAACGDDALLRVQVMSLIATQTKRAHRLGKTSIDNAMSAALAAEHRQADKAWIGRRLGAYEITHEIARGGMGAVYKAVRADAAYDKEVAIKIIRDGMARTDIRARFRAERQILASLEHPNIARLIDGGESDDGYPYLVMEYVDGQAINVYAQALALTITQKLDIFKSVCTAVAFAHQRLVVHRDLKPSNILVTASGEVKLLDFGIAKLIEPAQQDAAPTIIAMTPAYASPEQVKGETITTASDVYAIGVILYELLSGQSPYKHKATQPLELAKEICEQEPERPSTVVTRVSEATKGAPQVDEISIKRLQKGLRGDLDNIVLMALRKEPSRRYASVEQFAEDIRRYQTNLPVIARTDTWRYRAGKFVSRNRWPVGFAGATAVALVAGVFVSIQQTVLAQSERARAVASASEARQLANDSLFDIHTAIQDLPGSAPARKLLIEKAVAHLNRLETGNSTDSQLWLDVGWGWFRLAEMQGGYGGRNIGEAGAARPNYIKAIDALHRAQKIAPIDIAIANRLVQANRSFAVYLTTHGEAKIAMPYFDEAVTLGHSYVDKGVATPRFKRSLAVAVLQRASRGVWRATELPARIVEAHRARLLLEDVSANVGNDAELRDDTLDAQGAVFRQLGAWELERSGKSKPEEALQWLEKSTTLENNRLAKQPNSTRRMYAVGQANGKMADAYYFLSKQRDALVYENIALANFKRLATVEPNDTSATVSVLIRLAYLGIAQLDLNDIDGARKTVTDFDAHWRALPMQHKSIPEAELSHFYFSLTHASVNARDSINSIRRSTLCDTARASADTARAFLKQHPDEIGRDDPKNSFDGMETDLRLCS